METSKSTLAGQVALVTGASRGIGRAVALALGRSGVHTALLARSRPALEEVARQIGTGSVKALPVVADVRNEEEIKQAVEEVIARLGGLDILVNCAGKGYFGWVHETETEAWDEVLGVNLRGLFLCTRYALVHMLSRQRGQIVNLASVAGLHAYGKSGAYCASKFGVVGFSRALALEVKKRGVRVHTICPGAVDTGFWENASSQPDRSQMLLPEEIAGLVVDVLSFSGRGVVSQMIVNSPLGVY